METWPGAAVPAMVSRWLAVDGLYKPFIGGLLMFIMILLTLGYITELKCEYDVIWVYIMLYSL